MPATSVSGHRQQPSLFLPSSFNCFPLVEYRLGVMGAACSNFGSRDERTAYTDTVPLVSATRQCIFLKRTNHTVLGAILAIPKFLPKSVGAVGTMWHNVAMAVFSA